MGHHPYRTLEQVLGPKWPENKNQQYGAFQYLAFCCVMFASVCGCGQWQPNGPPCDRTILCFLKATFLRDSSGQEVSTYAQSSECACAIGMLPRRLWEPTCNGALIFSLLCGCAVTLHY